MKTEIPAVKETYQRRVARLRASEERARKAQAVTDSGKAPSVVITRSNHFNGHNKAQHSPLPWTQDIEDVYDNTGLCVASNLRQANSKLIVRAVNHADKLAEALRKIQGATHPTSSYHQWATDELDAYEAAQ